MKNLIRTNEYVSVYGRVKGSRKKTELFRCKPRDEERALPAFVENTRSMLGFEPDNTDDLWERDGYLGYLRLRRGSWRGDWFDKSPMLSILDEQGAVEIADFFAERFPNGCGEAMQDFLKQFPQWDTRGRYQLKPVFSSHYVVMVDPSRDNEYPVRVYVYS